MKLIDLLVKELPKRGGWPECDAKIHQDHDGETWAWLNHDSTERLFTLDHVATNARKFGQDETCENMVTRDQYEAALAASKAVVGHDGWIQWAGGDCPVDSDAIVEVKYRNPNQYQFNSDRAGDFYWSHDGLGYDIIAYRTWLHSRANDDRLEQDLNECIGQDVDATDWSGEGLPPVGVECEFKCATGEWVEVEITPIARNGVCFVECGKNGENYVSFSREFRLLRTEADKKRDEAIQGMESVIDYRNGCSSKPLPGWIYEAIAEGKIPGVKLEEK